MEDNLELEFSPSFWSKRFNADDVIKYHIEFVTKESEKIKSEIQCELNIPYGGSNQGEKYDIFGTNLPDDSPILIYIHGGYWQELSRNISSYVVRPFYENGIKTIILGYDLCPNVTLPEIMEEIKRGFIKCVQYALEKKSRGLFLSGHSAGAHLVSSLFMNIPKSIRSEEEMLKAVFLFSGVYNLEPLTQTYVNKPLKLQNNQAVNSSPLLQPLAWGRNIKFYIFIGEYESEQFCLQSKSYYEKLTKLKYKAKFIEVKGVDHFDLVERLNEEDYEVVKLMLSEMK